MSKKFMPQLIIAIAGVFAVAFAVVIFNNTILMKLPLGLRMVMMIVSQWLLFLVPGIMMRINKERFCDLGFVTHRLLKQVLIGLIIAVAMSGILTILPILLGFKSMVGSTNYTQAWQYAYQFVYTLFGVALVEEVIFRGYVFHKLLQIKDSKWLAIVLSSVLFGFFHIFSGNLVQVAVTAVIGLIYCMCREKIKDCTLLSLIIAHGVYDGLLTLWVGVL